MNRQEFFEKWIMQKGGCFDCRINLIITDGELCEAICQKECKNPFDNDLDSVIKDEGLLTREETEKELHEQFIRITSFWMAELFKAKYCLPQYYYLKKDEIIQEGDEVDMCRDGWRDDPKWEKVKYRIGEKAPDPCYPSHTRYRRLAKLYTAEEAYNTALNAILFDDKKDADMALRKAFGVKEDKR
jgi:hypothetical protein